MQHAKIFSLILMLVIKAGVSNLRPVGPLHPTYRGRSLHLHCGQVVGSLVCAVARQRGALCMQ